MDSEDILTFLEEAQAFIQDNYAILIIIIICTGVFVILVELIRNSLKNPFHYPYKTIHFDVSGRRNPQVTNWIDDYINQYGFDTFSNHYHYVEEWKETCQEKIEDSVFKLLRKRQYEQILDDERMFQIVLKRQGKPYRKFSCSYQFLKERYHALESIGFSTTLNKYHQSNQRSLMTPELKEYIKRRDNYTCQQCGRYMPDSFGLEIDHIIPVSKGGKSIADNLQVLCSECNRRKSDKLPVKKMGSARW